MKFYAVFYSETKIDNNNMISKWEGLWQLCDTWDNGYQSAILCLKQNEESGVINPCVWLAEVEFVYPTLADLVSCAFRDNHYPQAQAKVGRMNQIQMANLKS